MIFCTFSQFQSSITSMNFVDTINLFKSRLYLTTKNLRNDSRGHSVQGVHLLGISILYTAVGVDDRYL